MQDKNSECRCSLYCRIYCDGEAQRRRTVTFWTSRCRFAQFPPNFTIVDGETAFTNARTVCPDALIELTTARIDTAAYLVFCEATGGFTGVEALPVREAFRIETGAGSGASFVKPFTFPVTAARMQ